jgi:hypothetical protein
MVRRVLDNAARARLSSNIDGTSETGCPSRLRGPSTIGASLTRDLGERIAGSPLTSLWIHSSEKPPPRARTFATLTDDSRPSRCFPGAGSQLQTGSSPTART